MRHSKTLLFVGLSAVLLTLNGCSQQQVSGDGASQVAGGGSQQAAAAENSEACAACNAPIVEAIKKPKPATPAKKVAKSVPVYKKRRHVPTVPSKKNASSAMVANIQKALRARGYNPGNVDGVMGARTAAALHAFQKANRLPTGDLNRATMRALGLMR